MSNVCMYTESSVAQESAADAAEHSEQLDVEPDDDTRETTDRPSQNNLGPYLCPVCDKRFASKYYLKLHKKIHTGDFYLCSQCDKSYSFQSSLIQHMNIHAGKYKCVECGKCCHSNRALIQHRQSHSVEKLFECSFCGKRLATSRAFVVHMTVHTGKKRNKRPMSEKVSSESASLNSRMRDHGDEESYNYSLSNNTFSQGSDLQQVEGNINKPYQCSYCWKPFETDILLERHLRIHTAMKPYSCGHCSDCFTFPGQLRQHLLTSHNEGTSDITF